MKDYWKDLPYRAKVSKIERFNYIMEYIDGLINGNEGEPVEDGEDEETVLLGDVHISVIDSENASVSGVNVVISNNTNEYEGTTGGAGGCNIRNVPYGDYVITANKEGYESTTDNITIDKAENDIELILNIIST